MALPATINRATLHDYFRMEAASEVRHEYRDGEIVSMAGGRFSHSRIAANIIRELGNGLRGKPCGALDSNIRIRIPRKLFYFYPDASVVCGAPEFDDSAPAETTLLNPILLVEVVSDSSEAFDRGDKFTHYRTIESLREYVLVAQHTARVEIYLRQDDGTWRFKTGEGINATAHFDSINVNVPLKEIYAGVTFPNEANPAEPAPG